MEEIINGLKQIKTRVDSGTITTVNGTETLLSKQLAKMIESAINYTRCSLQLKDKKAPTFEHWLICNFEETKSGKYIDFNNGDNYRDKEVLKLKYNKIFKPTL